MIISNQKLNSQWGGPNAPLTVFDPAGHTGSLQQQRALADESRYGRSINNHTRFSSGLTGGPWCGAVGPGNGGPGASGGGTDPGGSLGGTMGSAGGNYVGGQNPGFTNA